jgi:futalosine hydrolase
MKILVVAATEAEILPLIHTFRKQQDGTFISGKLHLDLLITGVGMTATAYFVGKAFRFGYDFALNLGLAGSFNRYLDIGSVVDIVQDNFSELGAEDGDNFIPLQEMNLGGRNEVVNKSVITNKTLLSIPKVSGITVNTVHGREESIVRINSLYHPYTESMEGAAFLMCCDIERVPCSQIRAISNYVERRDRDKWNIPLAITNLNKKAIEILKDFES